MSYSYQGALQVCESHMGVYVLHHSSMNLVSSSCPSNRLQDHCSWNVTGTAQLYVMGQETATSSLVVTQAGYSWC